MRIYRRIILSLATGRVIARQGQEYLGPVAQLKGAEPPPIPPVQEPPELTDPAVEEARRKERELLRRRRGRGSTILTGGLGVTEAAPVARKTLLGE